MPPGPAYNWLCAAHAFADILGNAARIRAAQLDARAAQVLPRRCEPKLKRRAAESRDDSLSRPTIIVTTPLSNLQAAFNHAGPSVAQTPSDVTQSQNQPLITPKRDTHLDNPVFDHPPPAPAFEVSAVKSQSPLESHDNVETPTKGVLPSEISPGPLPGISETVISEPITVSSPEPVPSRKLQSSKVPSSRIGRLFHYGGLAASLGYGAASEMLRRSTQSSGTQSSSVVMTEANIKRLVSKLTQMRGAALKLGQFMSIQDSQVLPPELEDIFRRVQDSAHYMPDWQMEEVMHSSLGPSWMDNFVSFERVPFAAASIGQVHSAVLAPHVSPTGNAERVAVKIQFPNIVNSINSDLGYVKLLLTAGRLLPKGLFLDKTIQVAKEELADECDYAREATFLRKFGSASFLGNDPRFKVPWAWDGSTDRVLVMEYVDGVSVGSRVIDEMSQRDRNDIAALIIELCLKELFVFRAMQTDPNWTNFLWNGQTRQIDLIDFGATREYSKEFIDQWLRLLQAAASDDRQACIDWSLKVGYLTGEENETMLDAHVKSMSALATPFKRSTPQPFTFGPGSAWSKITADIRSEIPVMLQHRLTPPPRETYSLNRKLSGAFLLAARLNAEVDCYKLWNDVVQNYQFD
ncbi:ABC1-domain-containing protein [Irpex rosettiformis]|uniref:ABC1-domain-containing protein n=1 Tax=Irpex rosettiformis TaxID=378272 RepID=A0ACB8TNT0_9APHY|nr:ABC1-domain-containing protein [Irpex rosettiformis]